MGIISTPTPPPPPLPSEGATYREVLERLATVSSRISEMLRALGIGVVVFCWGLFTADKGLAQNVAVSHRIWIVVTAAIAVTGLLFDLLHAIVAYRVADRLRLEMEDDDKTMAPYPSDDLLYRSQTFFFTGKAILMPVATISIIILLFVMVLHPQPPVPPPAPPVCNCQCSPAVAQPIPTPQPPISAPAQQPQPHRRGHRARTRTPAR